MCILFFKTLTNPQSDEYYLVLVNVRDEYYSRPTQICSFWENDSQIIGAKDSQKGREGGTWLAMNTNGKIGVLLNILEPDHQLNNDKKSRGFLVVEYLKSNYSPKTYFDQISKEGFDYNGFRMLALHIKPTDIEISLYCNFHDIPVILSSGVYAFGNNRIESKLWPKVEVVKKRFEETITKYCKTCSKSQLIDDIFEILSDKTKYALDEQLKTQGKGKPLDILEKLSAVNVEIPEIGYGSRTWTIILIDGCLNVDYIEKTLKEPINVNNLKDVIITEKKFKIQQIIDF